MNHWLLKTEPTSFGLEHLRKCPRLTTAWDGVRNFQARNFLRAMKKGDQAFFYHSSCETPGIAAVVEVVRAAYPDPSAFDPGDDHYDPKSNRQAPRWFMVDVKLRRALKRTITLQELKSRGAALAGFTLLRPGNRLSVMPVNVRHWKTVLGMETAT
jgi:predicted RNA-binding protein with PUA-like domain